MATLGDRIRERREELGLSHAKLAELVKKHGGRITASGLVHLEQRSSERTQHSREIAMALGVNHDWLTSGKGAREAVRSLDKKLELLPQDEYDEVYDDLSAIIDRRLERNAGRNK
jgi:transcriptional regulator with XRE-family HTH domain